MSSFSQPIYWILGTILLLASVGVISAKKPVHACLSFLLTLLTLAVIYLQLSADFIAVMQVLVYAGAILVIFMFVIVLFQDAYLKISQFPAKSMPWIIYLTGCAVVLSIVFLGRRILLPGGSNHPTGSDLSGFGSVEVLGKALYVDFFFPFEAVVLLFLVASVGALYIGKKER